MVFLSFDNGLILLQSEDNEVEVDVGESQEVAWLMSNVGDHVLAHNAAPRSFMFFVHVDGDDLADFFGLFALGF